MLNDDADPSPVTRRALIAGVVAAALTGCAIRGRNPPPSAPVAARILPNPELSVREPVRPLAPIRKSTPSPTVTIIPRSEWTDNEVGLNADPMGSIRHLTIHHTGEHLSSSGISDHELLRRIERHHQANLGWAAIGYHLLIGDSGAIYEGRPLRWQGAHCGGDNNRNNVGISVIGEFDSDVPTPAQLQSLSRLLAHYRATYQVPAREVYGHRDWKNTACPGDALYAWLKDYRIRTT